MAPHPPTPPNPPFLCPFVQLLFSSSLYSLMQLILFQLAPRSSVPFLTPTHGCCLTEEQEQSSATDSVTLPSLLPSSLPSSPSLVQLQGRARVVRLSVSMKLKYSCACSAPSNNRWCRATTDSQFPWQPLPSIPLPSQLRLGGRDGRRRTRSRSLPPYSKWAGGWLWQRWMRIIFVIVLKHIFHTGPAHSGRSLSCSLPCWRLDPAQPCTGTFKLLTIMQLHNDS